MTAPIHPSADRDRRSARSHDRRAFAYAQSPSAEGVITGCYTKSGGTIRIIDAARTNRTSKETKLTWNQKGQPGTNGTNGIDGKDGTDGTDGTDGVDGADGTDGILGAYHWRAKSAPARARLLGSSTNATTTLTLDWWGLSRRSHRDQSGR